MNGIFELKNYNKKEQIMAQCRGHTPVTWVTSPLAREAMVNSSPSARGFLEGGASASRSNSGPLEVCVCVEVVVPSLYVKTR